MLDNATSVLWEQMTAAGARRIHDIGAEAARANQLARLASLPPGPEMQDVVDTPVLAPGRHIPARLFVPAGQPAGVLLFLHGGGWVLDGLDAFDHTARRLAATTGCVVVLIDYRAAPEHVHPAALDDAWAGLQWIHEGLGVDLPAVPLALVGESAGGNLAAVCALRAAESGIPLAAQVLIYPVTDADFDRPSYLDPANQLLVDRPAMMWCWDQYAPEPDSRTDPALSPLRTEQLPASLAPAVVLTAEHDVLRDEGELYVELLRRAGVAVTHRRFAGQMHGFVGMPQLPASQEALDHVAAELTPLLSSAAGPR